MAYCAPEYDFLLESEFRERVGALEAQNRYALSPQSAAGGGIPIECSLLFTRAIPIFTVLTLGMSFPN